MAGLVSQRFLQGEPKALGTTLLMIGLVHLFFAAMYTQAPCQYRDDVGILFFPALMFLLAGAVSVAAERVPSIAMVKACLTLCIICAIISSVVNFFNLVDLLFPTPQWRFKCNYNESALDCQRGTMQHVHCSSSRIFLLVLNFVGTCIVITLSGFGCRTVCHNNSEDNMHIDVLKNPSSLPETAASDTPQD
ncbi:membrane-spanning 4-domains subfamily A member 4A isoform X2 [Microcaecilia unicolor]|nr:membrane-spanning 4-domains subfamily A member 4A-like isoform X2 [Microcaecilia unicolor]XP_030077946.1 membrane-spanning 4-domains subfamily A member 4A-like isoform X2 [Microcaecilia unicolor]